MITEQDIVGSPNWFPFQRTGSELRWLRLNESAYRAASFLDQRLLSTHTEQVSEPLSVARSAAARLTPRSHYIFHTGHVGSTLISRLVGTHESLFSLREPALLRALASGPRDTDDLDLCSVLALLSRTWRPTQRTVIKATSFVSELAEEILGMDPQARAILMFADPISYLRGILGGPNSRVESRHLAPSRLARLAKRLSGDSWRPDPRSEGEYVAMAWLCEMTALWAAAERHRSRVMWVNFDAFLAKPAVVLDRVFHAIGAENTASDIEALVRGPLMRQYSKAPEYAYDAELRRDVQQAAQMEHGAEIRRGAQWLERLAGESVVRTVLEVARLE
jgi:hypothetical protein